MKFEKLPSELLHIIMEFIPWHDLLLRLSPVCSTLRRQALTDALLWKFYALQKWHVWPFNLKHHLANEPYPFVFTNYYTSFTKENLFLQIFMERYFKDLRLCKILAKPFWTQHLEYEAIQACKAMGFDVYEKSLELVEAAQGSNCLKNMTVRYYAQTIFKYFYTEECCREFEKVCN